jgi:hypothetical protein
MASAPEIPVHALHASNSTSEKKRPESSLPPVIEDEPSPYPSHPIVQLQGPFEESIVETTNGSAKEWVVEIDAQTRRRDLLENDEYERLCGRKWRQRASERLEANCT